MALGSPDFSRSQLKVLGRDGSERPWRWNPAPVYGNGPMQPPTVAGVKLPLDGVVILMDDPIVDSLRTTMTQTEKDECAAWVNRYTEAQCATWNVPVWAGQNSAVAWRVPAAIWDNPTSAVPVKVRTYFRELFA